MGEAEGVAVAVAEVAALVVAVVVAAALVVAEMVAEVSLYLCCFCTLLQQVSTIGQICNCACNVIVDLNPVILLTS